MNTSFSKSKVSIQDIIKITKTEYEPSSPKHITQTFGLKRSDGNKIMKNIFTKTAGDTINSLYLSRNHNKNKKDSEDRYPVIPFEFKDLKSMNPVLEISNKTNFLSNLNKLNNDNPFFNETMYHPTKIKFNRSASISFIPTSLSTANKNNKFSDKDPLFMNLNPLENPEIGFSKIISKKRIYDKIKEKSPIKNFMSISNISVINSLPNDNINDKLDKFNKLDKTDGLVNISPMRTSRKFSGLNRQMSSTYMNNNHSGSNRLSTYYCPFCDHCNQLKDRNYLEKVTVLSETSTIINQIANHIMNSQYVSNDLNIEKSKINSEYFEKTLNVAILLNFRFVTCRRLM